MSQSMTNFLSQTGVWVGVLGLASFLALFWVLRGVPLGQAARDEDDVDAPRGGYRDRVIAAVTLGLVLIVVGAYLAATRGVAWAAPAFALGFGTVLTLVAINRRHRHGSPALRRTLDLSTAALNASLLLGVLIVLNVLAFRYGGKPIDMTSERAYSLSSLSVNQMRGLPKPVTLTAFFGKGQKALMQSDRVQELLDLYRAANPDLVRVDRLDPDRDLTRYEALVKKAPDIEITRGGGVLVEYGEGESAGRLVVRNQELFDDAPGRFDPDVERFQTSFKGEDAITSAVIRLIEGKKPRVVFTTGHGEPSPDDTGRVGLALLRGRLLSTGSEVSSVNLLTDDLPADTAAVLIVGPKAPFKPEEIARLKAAADRKVPLLVLTNDAQGAGLAEWLTAFDLVLGRGIVLETQFRLPAEPSVAVVPVREPDHPIVDPLRNYMLAFPRPVPVKFANLLKPGSTPPPVVAAVLLRSSRDSWVETSPQARRDPSDESGPVPIAVAVSDRPPPGERRPGPPRLVLFATAELVDNRFVQGSPSNLDLVMNALSWLRGRPSLQGISPKTHVALTLSPDPVLKARLVAVPTVMAVLLILTLGLTTYLARRA